MNRYKCSDGSWITKAGIDRKVKDAKRQVLQSQIDNWGYNFCEDCKRSSGVVFTCAHETSVNECQKNGHSERSFDISNIKIKCLDCHKLQDGLDLKFINK